MKVFRPATTGCGVRLLSTGAYLPSRVVTNQDLVAMGAPLEADEMLRLSGIRERRWAPSAEATSDLATQAGRQALLRAGIPPHEVARLIVATVSPDHSSPSSACLTQAALGLGLAPAMDVTASCSGFLYALDLAARAVVTGESPVLAIAADIRSRYLDVHDRATCALFGDGAGAALVGPAEPGTGLIAIGLGADGTGAKSVYVPAGGSREPATAETVAGRRHTIQMQDGPQVYLSAVEGMLQASELLLAELGMTFEDVDLLVPHQANLHILKRVAWRAKIPLERVAVTLDRTGNISGATVPVALDEALCQGRVREGSRILLVAAGAGYTFGAALYVVDAPLLAACRS